MVLNQFRRTGPGMIFLIAVILLALWSGSILFPDKAATPVAGSHHLPLYSLILAFPGKAQTIGLLFTLLLAGLMAIVLVNFNTRDFFIGERTFLPALFYVLLTGVFTGQQNLNPVLPASFFLLLALIRINGSYRVEGTAYSFFDAGLLMGVGSLFYGNLAWFFVLLFVGMAIYRPFNLTEIITSIIGVTAPWILTFGFYYISGRPLPELISNIGHSLFTKSTSTGFGTFELVILIIAGAVILISAAYLFADMGKMKIKSRKTFYLLAWVLVVTAAIIMLVPSVSEEAVWIAYIPVCYFLSYFFLNVRKRVVRESVFFLLVLLVIAMQVFYYLKS